MFNLTNWLTYGFFALCLVLGWFAAKALDFEGIIRRSTSNAVRILFRIGVTLVLAEGFRIFLSYLIGPILDSLYYHSMSGFKMF